MTEEIMTLYGNSFKIWYETLNDRIYAIEEAKSLCPACNKTAGARRTLRSLSPTCTATAKTVGQTLTLTSSPTGGTPPYNYSFYKMLPGSTTPTWLGTQHQSSNTLTYTTVTADITNASGQQVKVGAVIYDSCPGGVQSSDESCFVNVTAPCTVPAVNLNVS